MKEFETKFFLQNQYYNELKNLPWNLELDKWEKRGIKFLNFRKGISRHPVKFLRVKYTSFAVKQTTLSLAKHEVSVYKKLLSLGIHAIVPVGYIASTKNHIEVQANAEYSFDKNELAFVITLLEVKALPDSYLYQLNFKEKNLKIIWDAVAELLAALHYNNIFWGDPSLGNALVRFFKVKDDKGRVRTELKAILADAETVRIFSKISAKRRTEELRFFFDSMYWLNEDFKKAGFTRVNITTSKDKKYVLLKYKEEYSRLKKIDVFEKETGLNVCRHFQNINNIFSLESIKKQIDEHKWYLSEKAGKEINIKDASKRWLKDVYYPIINEFDKLDIFECFPFTNSVGLYTDIMTHKYYLSREAKKDIGIEKAIKSYCKIYAADASLFSNIKKIFTRKKTFFTNGPKKII